MIKKIFYLFSLLTIFCGLASCSDSKDDPAPGITGEFTCNTESLSFPMQGGDNLITVLASVKPEVTLSDQWLSVANTEVTGTNKNIYKITISATANPDGNERTATATVKAGSNSKEIKITQSQKPMVDLDAASVAEAEKPFPADGGNGSLKITYNLEYKAEASSAWITIDQTRALQEGAIAFTVAPNNTSSERKASIIVSPVGASDLNPATVTISQEAGKAQDPTGMNARQIAADIRAGWNIGNTLEAYSNGKPSETAWGNPKVTEKFVLGLKAAGFNAIRIPCAWDGYIIDQENYTVDPAWFDRVNEVVGYCVNNDMYAIINIHWDGGWLEENVNEESKDKVLPKQKALWTQIANRLGGYNERLLFAGTNEPYQSKQGDFTASNMSVLLEYEQTFIDAVRATGGNNLNRTLIVQGPATNIDLTNSLMTTIPTDVVEDRLMAEIHFYDPWNFCGMDKDESWGRMAFFWGEQNFIPGSDRNSTWGDENYMKAQFDKMKTQFVDKGIPVVIGEYGAIVNPKGLTGKEKEANLASRAYFDKCVSQFGKERGLIPFLWDTGELIDRNTGEVKVPEIINAIMEGSDAAQYPY